MLSLLGLLVIGLLFHVSFIWTVFDCYFTSPVVNGMQRFSLPPSYTPAKRLVLIVGDGLRADLLFTPNGFPDFPHYNESEKERIDVVAPHLRSIVESRGAFGVSHTRVPTESRPGHVAIIAGMYEDVSAVTKGWKTNPVDFDSVFNCSERTYSFGSPDILPMFAKGAVEGRVKEWSYKDEEEDFTKDATALDTWVLDQVKTLFANATQDPKLHAELNEPKTIFFLHLLGLDTTGHSYRPFSEEYMRNIMIVDDIVREVESLLRTFYNEKEGEEETAYVFTADHGMSLIGNHGDGHPDNTRTPLVVWGKGARGPLPDPSMSASKSRAATTHDEYSAPWGLRNLFRQDLSQADLAPLMSTLLGLEWPVNSVGVLPGILPPSDSNSPEGGFVSLDEEGIALAAEVNAKVILEQFRVKEELKRSEKFFYKPFTPLSSAPQQLSIITAFIAQRSFTQARKEAYDLIQLGLEGLRYVETYDRTLLRTVAVFAYVGWGMYAALSIGLFRSGSKLGNGVDEKANGDDQTKRKQTNTLGRTLALLVYLGFSALFWVEEAPWTYFVYVAWPCWFWGEVVGEILSTATSGDSFTPRWQLGSIARNVMTLGTVGGILGCMVAGYTHRIIWSIGFVLMGVVWPLMWPSANATNHELGRLRWMWLVSSFANAIFPLLDVNKEEKVNVILSAGYVMLLVGGGYTYLLQKRGWIEDRKIIRRFRFSLILILSSLLSTRQAALSLQAKQGLPLLWQVMNWIGLVGGYLVGFVSTPSVPLSSSASKEKGESSAATSILNPITTKFLLYTLSLTPLFIILSISDEALFFISFAGHMWVWVWVESALGRTNSISHRTQTQAQTPSARTSHLRIALFFLFFVQSAFFGTGNVASISSFYLSPVYRLIPVFNPFGMAVPLLCKLISPYIPLSIAVASVTHALGLPPYTLFLLALTITDGMTLVFFFMVRDTGSWLEIGQTISFFIITNLLTLWSGGVCALGEWLMKDVLLRSPASGSGKAKIS